MPELPEVETIVRMLAPNVRGERIASAEVLRHTTLVEMADERETAHGRELGVSSHGAWFPLGALEAPSP